MQVLIIGQTYIDVTFLTDRVPTGDEKHVASDYAISFGGNAVKAAFCCAKLGYVPELLATVADDWQMGFKPAGMLDYLKTRGCRIGGATLGERGLIWYDETRSDRCRLWQCRQTGLSIPAGPVMSSMAPTSTLSSPTRRRAGRSIFDSGGLPPRTKSNASATRPDC